MASFTLADPTVKPKLRFSVDGAAAVDAYDPSWTTLLSGSDRRFRLQGATPVKGGKPAFYVEFGRGAALIEAGTYDCARKEAIALIVDSDESRRTRFGDGRKPSGRRRADEKRSRNVRRDGGRAVTDVRYSPTTGWPSTQR